MAPPGSIVFEFDEVERTENSFALRATGEHDDREFGFRLRWTNYYGPVALCEWWRTGEESDALIDIFADKAGIPRGDSRFEEYVRSAAIVRSASPADVPFAQRTKIQSKVCFDLAEGQPEITMDIDFVAKTGTIEERDSYVLPDLVHAFHAPEKAAPIDEDAGYRTD